MLLTQDEIKARFALIEKMNANVYEKASQYDNAVVGLGYVGFFALWTGVSHDLPRWSALITAALIAGSLTAFIAWTIVQMLGRHYATMGMNTLIMSEDERDLLFAQKWEAAEATMMRRTTKLIRIWAPIFYFSMATGLAGASLLAIVSADQAVSKLAISHKTSGTAASCVEASTG